MHNYQDKERNENKDDKASDLSTVWQAQPVNDIDMSAMKKNLSSERKKQRLFIIIDSLAFFPAIFMLYYFWGELTVAAKIIHVAMFVTAVPLLIYQLWLRRIAAFSRDSDTADHLQKFTKQVKNNIRIAFITKHSAWMATVILLAFIAERLLFGELSPERVTRLYVILGPTCIGMTVWYIWANKRQKRFEKQFAALKKMARDA
ncbi:hypothetical protein ACOJR9_18630 [Alteromonas sp. A081]|uniref:hypothetical protein n=1 Tax=Alteromonas sp. A081 TaxID=3410269 RepID=UPI003B98451A